VKIEKSSNPLPPPPVGEGQTRAPTAKPASAQTPAASSTSVNLGATATQLRSMESSVANTPLVDAAKVAEIKQAISEGRFQVNSGVVADKLIKSVTDLINSQQR
jgi:negative regulator of flagellin synthesis FlgM